MKKILLAFAAAALICTTAFVSCSKKGSDSVSIPEGMEQVTGRCEACGEVKPIFDATLSFDGESQELKLCADCIKEAKDTMPKGASVDYAPVLEKVQAAAEDITAAAEDYYDAVKDAAEDYYDAAKDYLDNATSELNDALEALGSFNF